MCNRYMNTLVTKKERFITLDEYKRLYLRLESSYICGQALGVPFYHTKEEHCYIKMIKSHYYKQKGAKDICVVCDGSEGLMSKKTL